MNRNKPFPNPTALSITRNELNAAVRILGQPSRKGILMKWIKRLIWFILGLLVGAGTTWFLLVHVFPGAY